MKWLLLLILVLNSFCFAVEDQQVTDSTQQKVSNAIDSKNNQNADANETAKLEKKKFKTLLLWTILLIISFMVIIFISVVIRSGRRCRELAGIGKKNPPTEHVDAWSNYRLSEKDMDIEPDIEEAEER
ncbi:MAG: hypothetical protein JEZ07_05500 [Phycisphaerae bacterium]|nr:hypothetical protein [Phycisphaerae bacterium]